MTPLFEVAANSPAIVNVCPEIAASTPSPPATAKVSPKFTFDTVELSKTYLTAWKFWYCNTNCNTFVIPPLTLMRLNPIDESSTATSKVLPVFVNALPEIWPVPENLPK